ncbi:hypothetical protein F0562_012477 [Nyssa sinensis]|uniref:U-box domain-containing protein n=1 Tax=Nyssa sinensis TaxID=561372 RepID=A0A5J4ZV84_9ASTE|nr:hypothetical protein F0562_012477 [Nyssa sinensis]
MKTHHPKLKTTPRPLFSCGFFRHCTRTVLSPTTSKPPTLPLSQSNLPPPPPPPPPAPRQAESESSSSSNTSQSFTQWRFPLPNSPISHHPYPPPESEPVKDLCSDSDSERVKALRMMERSLVPNPTASADGGDPVCPAAVMRVVVRYLKERAGAKPATKVLLALCLAEGNRHVAVEAGAVCEVVEALADLEGAAAERAMAALELLCTVAEGAAEVRSHALAVPMIVEAMGKMTGRGKEYAISVLMVIFSGSGEGVTAPPEEVARAVVLALQAGDCTARGKRKGAQLLKTLQENGQLDLTHDG